MQIKYKPDKIAFENEVVRRGITRLVHFTPTINLISIFERGALLSRSALIQLDGILPDLFLRDYIEVNDRLRLDELNNYINLSIQHPNSWLLRKFRELKKNQCESWCVIALSPECIWYADTLFSINNDASSSSKRHGIHGDYAAFCSLFQDNITGGGANTDKVWTRKNLADCYPTDGQAEVLVKGTISSSCITGVYFETKEEAASTSQAIFLSVSVILPPFIVDNKVFGLNRNYG